jgi:hypothetical protein
MTIAGLATTLRDQDGMRAPASAARMEQQSWANYRERAEPARAPEAVVVPEPAVEQAPVEAAALDLPGITGTELRMGEIVSAQ